MSFEGDKERLVRELADAQAEVRAYYGMAKRSDQLTDDEPVKTGSPGRRAATSD